MLNPDNIFVLIGKRGIGCPDKIGFYNIPSGYLDFNESGTEAAIREIYEETGLYLPDIDKSKIIFDKMDQPWHVKSEPDENKQNVSLRYGIVFNVDEFPVLTNEFSEPNEVEELLWVKISDIDKYEFAFNHDKVIMEFYKLFRS